jgi:hypothetical protein
MFEATNITVSGDDRKVVAIALEDGAKVFETAVREGHPSAFVMSVWSDNAAALRELARRVTATG